MATDTLVSMDAVEETYKALADRTRLRILALLMDGEVCVCDIHDTLRLPQPTASRHLAYLRRAGLVEARREGTWMHYGWPTWIRSSARSFRRLAMRCLTSPGWSETVSDSRNRPEATSGHPAATRRLLWPLVSEALGVEPSAWCRMGA